MVETGHFIPEWSQITALTIGKTLRLTSTIDNARRQVDEMIYPCFNKPLVLEVFRWMPRLLKLGRICDLGPSLLAGFRG